jgi:hypothetical protein
VQCPQTARDDVIGQVQLAVGQTAAIGVMVFVKMPLMMAAFMFRRGSTPRSLCQRSEARSEN